MKNDKCNLKYYKETKAEREERLKRNRSTKTQIIEQEKGKGSYNRKRYKKIDLEEGN